MRRLSVLAIVASLSAWVQPSWGASCDQTVHQGLATYYDFADGTGVCGYPAETGSQMVVALDAPELAATAMCGACIHIWGPVGEATVLVVNGCPGCEVGHLDLSPQAYALIASGYNGVPPITWQYVPCDVTGPVRYAYFAGSTTNWAWVQVRNHRHPIASFEAFMADGTFAKLESADWGYFKGQNLPAGKQTYRVTDIYGQQVQDTDISVLDQGEVQGKGQFPPCSGLDAGAGPTPDGSAAQDSGSTTPLDGSTTPPGQDASVNAWNQDDGAGCGCLVGRKLPASSAYGLLLVSGLLALRRRRRGAKFYPLRPEEGVRPTDPDSTPMRKAAPRSSTT